MGFSEDRFKAAVVIIGLLAACAWSASTVEAQGYWETVVANAGIATMHAAVSHDGNVVLLDRTNIGASQLALAPGVCRDNPADRVSTLTVSHRSYQILYTYSLPADAHVL